MCRQESDDDGGAGKRSRGRPKRRWLDNIRKDLSEENCQGRKRKSESNGGVSSTAHKSEKGYGRRIIIVLNAYT